MYQKNNIQRYSKNPNNTLESAITLGLGYYKYYNKNNDENDRQRI